MQTGTIRAGGSLVMSAGRDLSVLGGQFDVSGNAQLQAGRDPKIGTIAATTVSAVNSTAKGDGWFLKDDTKGTLTETIHQGKRRGDIGGSGVCSGFERVNARCSMVVTVLASERLDISYATISPSCRTMTGDSF